MSASVAMERRLSWPRLVRLGMVQAAIGAVVVLMTSTMNRVMVVELGLLAAIPGALVAMHFAVQLVLRPQLGHASDRARRRTPWILGGMVVLGVGGVLVALGVALAERMRMAGLALSALGFLLLGAGVSGAGTPLLALISEESAPEQKPIAAATTWILMIIGFVVTAISSGALLDPFSMERLVAVTAGVAAVAFVIAVLGVVGNETQPHRVRGPATDTAAGAELGAPGFRMALDLVWHEPGARLFAIFVFVAMLGYSAQDLILEPFGGVVFGLTPGESTKLAGTQHGGVLLGMIATALIGTRHGELRSWAAAGCAASTLAYVALCLSPLGVSIPVFKVMVFALGVANGVFAIGAIGSMMARSGDANDGRAGLRLGVFGAAQAVAYAIGGFAGAAGVDVGRRLLDSTLGGYVAVFAVEGVLFAAAAWLAWRSGSAQVGGRVIETRAELLPAAVHG
ncbi:MAG: BCD family MFS transporter [Gemmatimonadaceae bacterium]|jgi:BCD family chlorophyll transporter-like MFS transporter|nr:BCD family MFS transporter [Gemmatimonadaceae bacterium]